MPLAACHMLHATHHEYIFMKLPKLLKVYCASTVLDITQDPRVFMKLNIGRFSAKDGFLKEYQVRLSVKEHGTVFTKLLTIMLLSCRIFEPFALQTDPVTEYIKLGYALFKECATLVPKQADLLSFWRSGSTPSKPRSGKPDLDPLIFCTI